MAIPRPLSTSQTARRLGCTVETVRCMIRDGRLAAFRLGPKGSYRVWPDEIERFMRESAARVEADSYAPSS